MSSLQGLTPTIDADPEYTLKLIYDASWNAPPIKSVACVAALVFGGPVLVSVLNIPRVTPSSFAAELNASNTAFITAGALRGGLTELGVAFEHPTPVYGDNRSVNDMAKPHATPSKAKADAVRIGINQELADSGIAKGMRIKTDVNPVDFGTKPIGGSKFLKSASFLVNEASAVPPRTTAATFIERAKSLL